MSTNTDVPEPQDDEQAEPLPIPDDVDQVEGQQPDDTDDDEPGDA